MPDSPLDVLRDTMGDEALKNEINGLNGNSVLQAVLGEIEYEAVETMINAAPEDDMGRFIWATQVRAARNVRDKLASFVDTPDRRARV